MKDVKILSKSVDVLSVENFERKVAELDWENSVDNEVVGNFWRNWA